MYTYVYIYIYIYPKLFVSWFKPPCQPKVQKGLAEATHTRAPDPVAVSDQYVAAFDDEDLAAEEDDRGASLQAASGSLREFLGRARKPRVCKASKKRKGSAASRKKRAATKGVRGSDYSGQRQAFLDASKKDGLTSKQANAAWLTSPDRASLLATMSLSELKRRRFVPKGSTGNPFAVCVADLGG